MKKTNELHTGGLAFLLPHPNIPEAVGAHWGGRLSKWTLNGEPRRCRDIQLDVAKLWCAGLIDGGSRIAIATESNAILIYSFDSLTLRETLPVTEPEWWVDAFAFSPDGRWLAAQSIEEVRVFDRSSMRRVATLEAGEWGGGLAFDATSRYLAINCPYQAGSCLRVASLDSTGSFSVAHETWRAQINTVPEEFVDTPYSVAFSPDSTSVAIFETSAIYHDAKPIGWRGNVVLINVENGQRRWQRSIDASVTGDARSLEQIGYSMGYAGSVVFAADGNVLLGTTAGCVLKLASATGKILRSVRLPTRADVLSLAPVHTGECYIGLSDDSLMSFRFREEPA